MYLFLLQVLNELNNLSTRDATVEKLKANIKVLEDENGGTISVIPFKDAVIGTPMLLGNYEKDYELKLHDITQLSLRKDDILVMDYMKCGMLYVQSEHRCGF